MKNQDKKLSKNFDKKQYDMQYKREKLKRVPLDLPLEMAEKWRIAAKNAGIPLNTLIKSAVNEKIDELSGKP